MAVAKVILNGSTLIDVTQKTVVADKLLSGYTALKNDGTDITGSYSVPSGTKSITVSGAGTITEDVTNYANAAITTPAGSAATPATSITANPTISVSATGLVTATASASKSVTPTVSEGYVSSGTSGTVTVSGSATQQLSVYAGAHHSATSAYSVVVSLTNPINASEFGDCDISEWLSSSDLDFGNTIDTIDSPTGNITVSVSDSLYGVAIMVGGMSVVVPQSGISCTGGVSYEGTSAMGAMLFSVTGNGTITLDSIDYDD